MFTLGADPEVFPVTKEGQPVAALGLIPGTKEKPHSVSSGAVQVDGMALEFNIAPVSLDDFDGFRRNILTVMKELRGMVPDYKLKISPVQEYSEDFLKALPPAALELGCDPDYNAYTLKANPRPDGERLFRTGAGHIHIGWGSDIPTDNEEHIKICASFIKMLDLFLGQYMTIIDRDPRRRELYGKAGAFRPKSYGVEYRTPSNVWLRSKAAQFTVWTLIDTAVVYMKTHGTIDMASKAITRNTTSPVVYDEELLQRVINEGDHETAMKFIGGYFEQLGKGYSKVSRSKNKMFKKSIADILG